MSSFIIVSLKISRLIKLRTVKLIGRVARKEEMKEAHTILVGKSERKIHLGELGVDERIILK
jgi:hypothetical protein